MLSCSMMRFLSLLLLGSVCLCGVCSHVVVFGQSVRFISVIKRTRRLPNILKISIINKPIDPHLSNTYKLIIEYINDDINK